MLVARLATAQPPASPYAAGLIAYQAGDYVTAIAAFEEAFRSDSRAEVAFTLAQAHRNQYFIDKDVTHLHRALGLYRHYLHEQPNGRRAQHAQLHLETIQSILDSLPPHDGAPVVQATELLVIADVPGAVASIDGDRAARMPRLVEVSAGAHAVTVSAAGHDPVTIEALAVAERLVVVPAALHPRPAQLVVHAGGAHVEVDGRAIDGVVSVTPGDHAIAVTARGHRGVLRVVDVAAASTIALDVALAPTPQRRAARIALFAAAGLAGAAGFAGGLAYLAQRDAESIPDAPNRTAADLDHYRDAVDRRDAWRSGAIGLAIGAGVVGVAGAALYWFDVPPAPERPAVTPLVGPETVGVAVSGAL